MRISLCHVKSLVFVTRSGCEKLQEPLPLSAIESDIHEQKDQFQNLVFQRIAHTVSSMYN